MLAPPLRTSPAGRAFALIGGLLFVSSLLYFLARYYDFGAASGAWTCEGWKAVAIDVTLFSIFALHHSVFARTGIKTAIKSWVSESLERASYVWLASLLFALTLWSWAPVPGILWQVEGVGAWLLYGGMAAGIVLTALAASALDPLELAGIRQVLNEGRPTADAGGLMTTGAYGLVRHPIYLGWTLIVWSVPVMTGTRLVFAAISTLYLVVAVPLEEREMRRTIGQPYEDYARTVRWRILPGIY